MGASLSIRLPVILLPWAQLYSRGRGTPGGGKRRGGLPYHGLMAVSNQQIIALLRELVALTILEEESAQAFRVRALENAIVGIESETRLIAEFDEKELTGIKGVGTSTASKIREFLETGSIKKLEALREAYPPDFVALSRIPGVGPKTLKRMRSDLNIENLDDLKAAIDGEKLRDLPGLGAKSEAKIAQSIERLGLHGKDRRTPIAEAMPIALDMVAELGRLDVVEDAQYCGSLRRFSETIGDVDIIVSSNHAPTVMEHFVGLPSVAEVIAHGETKSSVISTTGLQVDVRVVTPEEYGAAMLYFTGSKAHNIKLRQIALSRGLLLNEYSLSDSDTGEIKASKTEAAIYEALGLAYIPPTMREDSGEIEAAADGSIPGVIQLADIRADLHYHSDWSGDGRSSIEDMIAAARERGYEYLSFTDHAIDLSINGLTRDQMLEPRSLLKKKRPRGLKILHGTELNIGRDGSLDYDLDFRLGFDWTVASVHSSFDLDPEVQTARLIKAISDPGVAAIGHLSGRMIGRRPGIRFEMEPVLEAALVTGTAIEINGALPRLDATVDVIRKGREMGVTFVISTDSHHVSNLRRMSYGVQQAQRGWLEPAQVLNTRPLDAFKEFVQNKRDLLT